MKCPDCGTNLTNQASVAGVVARCFKCGGFWLDAGTANSLTASEVNTWRRISVNNSYLSAGGGVCPADGTRLIRYSGHQVPMNVIVMHCDRCGKWWFPGDNLHKFKPALEAKKNYLRLWGLPLSADVILPLALVVFLAGATAVGVGMVRQPQGGTVTARGITEFAADYYGQGRGMAVFKSSQEVGKAQYRKRGDLLWKQATLEAKYGYYIVWMEGLEEGEEYILKFNKQEFKFITQ